MSQTKAQLIDPVDGTIVNADINASAAIAGSKISPDFGSQNVTTTGQLFSSYATLTAVNPTITFNDSDNNPDYTINVNSGVFKITDSTNTADRLVISSSGNVGIGTASPGNLLNLNGGSSNAFVEVDGTGRYRGFEIHEDGTRKGYFHHDLTGNLSILNTVEANLTFHTGDTEVMRLAGGQLLIGTTTTTTSTGVVTGIRAATESRIVVGNSNTSASGVCGYDMLPSNKVTGARIECRATEDFSTTANRTADLGFFTRKDGTLAEKLTILSDGKVGIGLTNPTKALHVTGTSSPEILLQPSDASPGLFIGDSNRTGDGQHLAEFGARWNGTKVARIVMQAGDDTTNKDNGQLVFFTSATGTVAERLRINEVGDVGINESAPSARLHVNGGGGLFVERSAGTSVAGFKQSGGSSMNIYFQNSGSTNHPSVGSNNQDMTFGTDNNERARIKSNGAFGINTSSPQTNGKGIHIQNGTVTNAHYDAYVGLIVENTEGRLQIVSTNDGNQASQITLTNAPTSGDNLHWVIEHSAALASNAFHIGHLTSTSGYPTSTLDTGNFDVDFRILTSGIAQFSNHGSFDGYVSATDAYQMRHNIQDQTVLWLSNTNTSHTRELLRLDSARAGSSQFFLANFTTGNLGDDQFLFRGDGNAYQDGGTTWSTPADYAEMFEWEDGNPNNEDRRGISVVLVGDKIRAATSSDDTSQIIGVISGNPAVTGDGAYTKWHLKYLLDDYNNYILDENGERKLNPDYDSTKTYIPREDRKEWSAVGMLGKLRVKVNQPVGASWIKLKNVSDSVEQWLVR